MRGRSWLIVAEPVDPDSLFVDDPQPPGHGFRVQVGEDFLKNLADCFPPLGSQPEDDKARVVLGGEHLNVGEVQVKRQENSSLLAANLGDLLILVATKSLVVDRGNVVAAFPEEFPVLRMQVLI